MKLWPTSFVARSVATTLLSLLTAQLVAAAAFVALVLMPQSQRVADVTARSLAAVTAAADSLPPAERARLIEQLGRSELIEVWPGDAPPPAVGGRPRMLERYFMQALVERLPAQREMEWRTDASGRLWLQIALGPDWYWMSVRAPLTLRPVLMLLLASGATLALALAAAVAAQRRVVRPLGALARHVEAFRPGSIPPPVPDERGPDEVVALRRGYNALIERLRKAEADRALLLAGVSHDIRTPLAKLRLAIEMMPDADADLSASARRQIREIDRIVDQFVVFARGADAEPPTSVNVDALVSEVVEARRADGAPVELDRAEAGRACVRPESLRRALANLLGNAERYGRVPVRVVAERRGDHVRIAVRDAGDGVPDEALTRILEPFVRGETARASPGTGLGLAIAADAARAHGGELRLENLDGGGFLATLVWPAVKTEILAGPYE